MGRLARPAGLQVGDRVHFDGATRTVAGLAGTSVRLVTNAGEPSVVLLAHLLGAPDFELLEHPAPSLLPPLGLLEGLPDAVVERARWWERHIVEVISGLPPDAPEGAQPRGDYDPARPVRQRDAAKAAELTAAGQPISAVTVQRLRLRYQAEGLWGLVDQRSTRSSSPYGRADPRLVAAIRTQLDAETDQSTGTRGRLRRRVAAAVEAEHGPGVVAMPSKATFNRLVAILSAGRHTFGSARTRRSLANRPQRPFAPTLAARPGEQVQIDSTPLDVLACYEDGVPGRVELTAAVDVATRTICAAVLRPVAAKAVDAALLLARMLVPEPLRPGWADALAMAHSRLPYARLVSLDARLEQAAAKPVIMPDTIVIDHGKVFCSEAFLRACQTLGISVQPAHPRSPTDKAVAERTFGSINSLWCQHVAGYVGASVERRGRTADQQALWSIPDLQDLLDEWIIVWQHRPHDGLRDPQTGRTLSPNEAYAALVAAAGYLPVTLTGEDYLELLPAAWRSIQDYGIRLEHRTYDAEALNPYRRLPSGVRAKQHRWGVHYDPYDLSQVWVRNHHDGGWITVPWTHQGLLRQPFADFTWRAARKLLAERGGNPTDETAITAVLAELLARGESGPSRAQRTAARTRTTSQPSWPRPAQAEPADQDDQAEEPDRPEQGTDAPAAKVVPLGIFDPYQEASKRW